MKTGAEFELNGLNPRQVLDSKNGASTEEPDLRARRSQLNIAFASAEALCEGGLKKSSKSIEGVPMTKTGKNLLILNLLLQSDSSESIPYILWLDQPSP